MSFVDSAIGIADQLIGDLAGNYALITSPNRYIDTLFPDVVVRELHEDSWTITVHPVSTGTPISDHKFRNPRLVEIVFGFSDDGKGVGYTVEQYQAAVQLGEATEPFDVSTGKRFYTSMLVQNISTVTDEQFESAGIFTMRLQESILTSTDGGAATADNQANPQQTSSETPLGTQQLQSPGSGLTDFSTAGPTASTGTSVVSGGGSAFASYMTNFSTQ